jgi:thioredoxin 1
MAKSTEDVVFLKVDVDEAEDAATEYNISAMPTFVLIKSNAKVLVQSLGSRTGLPEGRLFWLGYLV